jgi:hypothetical protein
MHEVMQYRTHLQVSRDRAERLVQEAQSAGLARRARAQRRGSSRRSALPAHEVARGACDANHTERSTIMKAVLTLLAVALAATALAVSASAAADERYIPGVTDFPSAQQSERYVPFVTDFPSSAPEAVPAGVPAEAGGGFGGLDAAFAAAIGVALGALGAASLPALRRRRSLSNA